MNYNNDECRLTVQLIDHTGSITLDLNGNDAEQLLPFTIAEIQKQEIQNKLDYTTIEDFIKQNNRVCLVKKTQNTYNSTAAAKYIAIIAHIRNSTPEELAVISKYTTNYATTSASWSSGSTTSLAEAAEKTDGISQETAIDVAMTEMETRKRAAQPIWTTHLPQSPAKEPVMHHLHNKRTEPPRNNATEYLRLPY